MTLTKEQSDKFDAALRKTPQKIYAKTIQTLMDIYHEDRLVIFTLMSVLGAYVQNLEHTETERYNHSLMLDSMFDDYDIKDPQDLVTNINNCVDHIKKAKLRHTVGGVQ